MWPLADYRFDRKILDALRARGFDCTDLPDGRVQASKNAVAAIFIRDGKKELRLQELPGYLIRGQFARLWDAGYQKFWLLGLPAAAGDSSPEPWNSPRVPALAEQLKNLHRVSEELRTVLGIPSFYNESLGTTCHVTTYDRLKGRDSSGKD